MISSTATALAGIPPYQLGIRSPLPFVHATYMAGEGWPVFPSNGDTWIAGSKEAATADLKTIRQWYEGDPATDWRIRTEPQDGLHAIKFPSVRHWEWLSNDMGPLPRTLVIERDGGHCYHLFLRGIGDSEFALHKEIHGSQAKLVSNAPLPGSRDRRSGEVWRWRSGCGLGESSLAYLPRAWLLGLPKKWGAGITAVTTERPEYRPRSPLSSGN